MSTYKKISHSYEGYLREIYYNKEDLDEQYAMEQLSKMRCLTGSGISPLASLYFINYLKQEYIIFSDSIRQISGYHSREFLDGGLDMLRYVYNKDDFKTYSNEIFTRNCDFLASVPQAEHQDYLFSYTFRVKSIEGGTQQIWQRGSYITHTETGLPLYSFGICQNITELKTDSRMIHAIEKINFNTPNLSIETNYFFPNQEDKLFSKKEKEVLSLLSEGFSTKQIADKMHVADTTIITHRKNMMEKSNTKNTAELIAYSLLHRII
ncbi:response regulator transcription factor [Sphingobacterium siyangense]|uniref:response regulator transcription factor n=1 Tax=Sphingobacterium siyangense TaxID=459529 RepID=UPI0019630436|nr:helix-turn-helix transcriptional regulator [Sphingobacterium siyangense]QRY58985.1 helix-turn-helix transcriptional regulator [Sphingobacterium siyangense]